MWCDPSDAPLISKRHAACHGNLISTGGSSLESHHDCQYICRLWPWTGTLWAFGLAFVVAVTTGLIFSLQPNQQGMLRAVPAPAPVLQLEPAQKEPLRQRLRRMMVIAGDEFFEMGRYLVIGSLLAALMQTIVPQSLLMAAGQGPLLSIFVMVVIAVLLSVCSTVDAFIALAFANAFSVGSILAFLVYGPMVDIKSTLLYLRVFKTRTVVYLVTLPLLITVIASAAMNYFGAW
jgi:uncharacterized protein